MPRLFQRADVYGENPSTGDYDILVKERLRCRAEHIPGGFTLQGRTEMADLRHFVFDGDYHMPQECVIDLEGTLWRPQTRIRNIRGTGGQVREKAVDIAEVRR